MLPTLFLVATLLQVFLHAWARRWLLSGAPILTWCILQGDAVGHRVVPFAHVWTLFATVNLAYAFASTSWLFYDMFTAACYPAIFVTCLFQFQFAGDLARKVMRLLLNKLHFIDDKIGVFNIPALEIDTDVDGLMVLRGITFSLSTLSFVVHGVDVGIKISDDLQLAIRTEIVTVYLFRSIEVGDCFVNLKGGKYERHSMHRAKKTNDEDGEALLVKGERGPQATPASQPAFVKMKYEMTDGNPPEDSTHRLAVKDIKRYPLSNATAQEQYCHMLDYIQETSSVHQARRHLEALGQQVDETPDFVDFSNKEGIRAAICSQLHPKPSIPHPPSRSIKVTTLQTLLPQRIRGFLHRLPMLLRLLLNPLSYFHPVKISSITATAAGEWIESLLVQKIFREYSEADSDFRHLKERISAWVLGANFAVELGKITGNAQVPVLTSYNIHCQLGVDAVLAYRALPQQLHLNQVAQLGGADATFALPSFLLPHHEHLLPSMPAAPPDNDDTKDLSQKAADEEDETSVKMSVHARLPALFDQELLDFIALLVKAGKLVEIEETLSETHDGSPKLKELPGALNQKVKDKLKKVVMANDQWLAKLVGKVMKKLEVVQGDVGYSGDLPVPLRPYRETGWLEQEGEKLLP